VGTLEGDRVLSASYDPGAARRRDSSKSAASVTIAELEYIAQQADRIFAGEVAPTLWCTEREVVNSYISIKEA
jgi:hypothetical protein